MDQASNNVNESGEQGMEGSTTDLYASSARILNESAFYNHSTEPYYSEDNIPFQLFKEIPNKDAGQASSTSNKRKELQYLLSTWELGYLFDDFIKERMDINILHHMKPKHLDKLMQNHAVGTQILFEINFTKWREDIGLPLVGNIVDQVTNELPVVPKIPNSNTGTKSTKVSTFPNANENVSQITLAEILNNSVKGSMITHYYEKMGRLQEEQRSLLISAICQYFFEKNIHVTLEMSKKLEEEICDRFPTEKPEFYRTGKRGKIYNKCSNLKSGVKSIIIHSPQKDVAPSNVLVPEQDAEYCERALKFDKLTVEEFDRTWLACSKYRIQDIRTMKATSEIFFKWPFYKQPSGYRLIDMDFNVLFPNNSCILDKWATYSTSISNFISKEGNIKDRSINGILLLLNQTENVSENSRNAVILWALHGYLVPTQKTINKTNTGKKSIIKYTIRDGQDSFLFVAKSLQEIEDHILFLSSKSSNIQPMLFAIGSNICDINEIFVYFDGVRFSFSNTLRAVDICFKIFHLFNLEYPLAATNFYYFIQELFYGITAKSKNTKLNILLNEIKEYS